MIVVNESEPPGQTGCTPSSPVTVLVYTGTGDPIGGSGSNIRSPSAKLSVAP